MMDRRKLRVIRTIVSYLENNFSLEEAVEKADRSMFSDIQRGVSLSEALRNRGFFEFIVQNVKIGEESGRLKDVLINIARIMEDVTEMQRYVRMSLVIPYMTFSLAVMVLFFVLSFVVPEIYLTISDIGVPTSGIVRAVSAVGMNIRDHAHSYFLVLVALLVLGGYVLFSYDLPFLRELTLSVVLRSAALCLKNGIELQRTLMLVSEATQSKELKEGLLRETINLMRGREPDFSFAGEFSAEMRRNFDVGRPELAFEKMAEVLSQRTKDKAEMIRRLIEPVFFVVVSAVIVFVVAFLYVPLLKEMIKMM